MKQYLFGCGLLSLWFLLPGCVAEEPSVQAEGDDVTAAENAAALGSERLAVDVAESYDCHIFGARKDYFYPTGGRRITRQEFHVEPHGHAEAEIKSIDTTQVKVHAWCDLFSGYSFTLKVWVED